MVRDSRRMALYEVIGKSKVNSSKKKKLSRLKSGDSSVNPPVGSKMAEEGSSPVRAWPNRPKSLRFYGNRVEFSLSWQAVVISILTIFAIFLVFFRLGRIPVEPKVASSGQSVPDVQVEKPVVEKPAGGSVGGMARSLAPKMVEPMGDNVIVIASFSLSSHLEPVKSYFAKYGIETEIMPQNGRYVLVTQQRYDNPGKIGTNGYDAKQKIIKIGAGYKPEKGSGFESFAPKLFSDAYGMKIKSKQE